MTGSDRPSSWSPPGRSPKTSPHKDKDNFIGQYFIEICVSYDKYNKWIKSNNNKKLCNKTIS